MRDNNEITPIYYRSTGVIAGIVVGCLFALGVVIAIIVCICKAVAKSSGSHGQIIQPTATSGTTVAYTNASQIGLLF